MFRPKYGYNARTGWRTPLQPSEEEEILGPEKLSQNVVTGTDYLGTTTGFNSNRGGVLSSSTDEAHSGERSLKVVTPGTQTLEGIVISTIPVLTATPYKMGLWVLAPADSIISLRVCYPNCQEHLFTGTGDWEPVSFVSTSQEQSNCAIYVRTKNMEAITFYLDDFSFKEVL